MLLMCHEPKGQPSIICVKTQQITVAVLRDCLCSVLREFVCVQCMVPGLDFQQPGAISLSVICPLPALTLIVFVMY